MEFVLGKTIAVMLALTAPVLTMLDLSGNTILLISSIAFAFINESMYFSVRILSAMILIYVLGEFWEFFVELFGIRRQKVSWFAVMLIGLGGFLGTLAGTMVLPVFGSLLGGMGGAFVTAFGYELCNTGIRAKAVRLAMEAAKMHFLALIGKMAAGIAMAVLLLKQVVFL